ncbi:siderochrome-iron transporter [Neolentinus lepideus HHB14362 ss-1]|uniref:Siderochrome-iron transporter n=1 Tax=Neolentinus lepideus HHB14362 ss-1 TaxID=1314782 RepID=A0A165SHU9_9AGAM|nr:siderochrome-iron transporter [Neolentinus lepideus HHB14362 ss-1]
MASPSITKNGSNHSLDRSFHLYDAEPVSQRGDIVADAALGEEKSPGVKRVEAIASTLTKLDLVVLFGGIFLIAYAYGLDQQTRSVYQTYATNSYSSHSLLSTLNVVKAVIAAAAQPPMSKVADIFGRLELISFSVFFYVLGTIIEAASHNVQTYAGGQVLYQIGLTGIQLLIEVLIADITSLRNRVFFSYIPSLPFIINTWISGNVTSAVIAHSTWQWGVGMWTIIVPATSIPILLSLYLGQRRAKKAGKLSHILPSTPSSRLRTLVQLFHTLDLLGTVLLALLLSLILIPLTIAGGTSSRWAHADVIVMLVIGFVLIPFFVLWELKGARHPIVPFGLLRDRSILAGLWVALSLNLCWYLQGAYLYTLLLVSFNTSVTTATRITSLYSFCSVVVGVALGGVFRYVRYIKWVAVAGTLLFAMALGLMVRYRSGAHGGRAGLIGAQVALGVAGGFFPYPVQALVQAATKHEHVAVITALYLTMYQIGSAFGNTISGAIWSNTLPSKLATYLAPINGTLAAAAYDAPLTFILSYPVGTPERTAVVRAYDETQRYLAIAGVCLAVPLFAAACCLKNPRLGDLQALPEAERKLGAAPVVEADEKADGNIDEKNVDETA